MRLPVVPQISTKDGLSNKNARLTNCLKEVKKAGEKAVVRPGLVLDAQDSGVGNGLVVFNNELVSVYGATLKYMYEENAAWEVAGFIGFSAYTNIIFANGKYIWVYNGGASYSSDGVTWGNGTGLTNGYYEGVAYGAGIYCVVSTNTSSVGIAATSSDGISWTMRTISNRSWVKVAYGNGIFIAIPFSGTVCSISSDGIIWAEKTLPVSSNWYDIQFDGTGFCVTGLGKWLTTLDGIIWATGSLPSVNAHWALATNGSRFVTVDYYGTTSYSDDHGNSWLSGSSLGGTNKCCFYALGYFWVVSAGQANKSLTGQFFDDYESTTISGATWKSGASNGTEILVAPISSHNGIRREITSSGLQTTVTNDFYDFAQSPI